MVLLQNNCWFIYLLSRCRSARHQTGRHHSVPGRWRSQGGSAHLTYGSPKPACERHSPSPLACRGPRNGQDFNLYHRSLTGGPRSRSRSRAHPAPLMLTENLQQIKDTHQKLGECQAEDRGLPPEDNKQHHTVRAGRWRWV